MICFIATLFISSALGWDHVQWLKEVEKRVDGEAVAWLRKQINPSEAREAIPLPDECNTCFKGKIVEVEDPKIYVCMSFSVPDNIWLALDKEMEANQAVFVVRGLPNHSFKVFAKKLAALKEKGMSASLLIHPLLFKEYGIDRVPAFIFKEHLIDHQLSGAVSLKYANELIRKNIGDIK